MWTSNGGEFASTKLKPIGHDHIECYSYLIQFKRKHVGYQWTIKIYSCFLPSKGFVLDLTNFRSPCEMSIFP